MPLGALPRRENYRVTEFTKSHHRDTMINAPALTRSQIRLKLNGNYSTRAMCITPARNNARLLAGTARYLSIYVAEIPPTEKGE